MSWSTRSLIETYIARGKHKQQLFVVSQQQWQTVMLRGRSYLHSSASGLSSQYLSRGSVLVCTRQNKHPISPGGRVLLPTNLYYCTQHLPECPMGMFFSYHQASIAIFLSKSTPVCSQRHKHQESPRHKGSSPAGCNGWEACPGQQRTEAFLWAMAADSSSTVSQAAAHSPALASSHCFLASAMAFSRLEMVSVCSSRDATS